jgi:hypothetical protein
VKRYLVWFALVAGLLGFVASAAADAPAQTPSSNTVVEKKAEAVPFGGFSFDFTMSDSTGLNAVGENYRNELAWYLEPSWNIGAKWLKNTRFKTFSIGGRFILTQALSGTDDTGFGATANAGPETPCSNLTPSTNGGLVTQTPDYCHPQANDRRTDYSDIWLTFRNPRIYTIPKLGIDINPSIRFFLPTSAQSQFQGLYLSMAPSLGVSRSFWKDHITLGYGFSFTKNFHKSTAPEFTTSGGSAAALGANQFDGIIGSTLSNFYLDPTRATAVGGYLVNYSLGHVIDGTITFNKQWSLDVLYIIRDAFVYGRNCNDSVPGYTVDTCLTGNAVAANSNTSLSRPGTRDVQVFWVTLGYQPLDWLGLALMYINWAPLQKPDSTYRQGIISTDYNAFTTLSLGATVSLDKVASKIWKN